MSTTGLISESGLVSGIDTTSLISKLVSVEQAPITALQSQVSAIQTTQSGIATLTNNLTSLDTLAQQLSDPSQVANYTVNSSDGTVSGVASSAATAGQYQLTVAQLATAQLTYSNEVSSETQAGLFGTGTIALQVGSGHPVSLSIGGSDTLDTVAQKINGAGLGMTAKVMYDGTGYRLMVNGPGTGSANSVSMTETGTTLGLSTPSNTVSQAQNAIFSIDGFTVNSASNTVSSALPGVRLTLNALTAGASYDSGTNQVSGGTPTTLTVASDPSGLQNMIGNFVSAYNTVIGQIATMNKASTSKDQAVNLVQTTLQRVIGQPLSGLTPSVQALSEIGVSTNEDGTLTLKTATLASAIQNNAAAVTNLFIKSSASNGLGAAVDSVIQQMTDPLKGTLTLDGNSLSKQTQELNATITNMKTQVTAYQDTLTAQFNAMETALSKINSEASTVSAFAAQMANNGSSSSSSSKSG